jgi:hypothetical protein
VVEVTAVVCESSSGALVSEMVEVTDVVCESSSGALVSEVVEVRAPEEDSQTTSVT